MYTSSDMGGCKPEGMYGSIRATALRVVRDSRLTRENFCTALPILSQWNGVCGAGRNARCLGETVQFDVGVGCFVEFPSVSFCIWAISLCTRSCARVIIFWIMPMDACIASVLIAGISLRTF
jgi:hypothetical protein